jgi:hypothetical protein
MGNIALIRNISALDEKMLEKYKTANNEKTNAKAFVSAIHAFFSLKEKIEFLENELLEKNKYIRNLEYKYEKQDSFFINLKSILKETKL